MKSYKQFINEWLLDKMKGKPEDEILSKLGKLSDNEKIKYKFYETIYYRGITDKTRDSEYIWLTKKQSHAEIYSLINAGTYGGDSKILSVDIHPEKYNLLNLNMYDMDEYVDEQEINNFLSDVNIEYDYMYLFDHEDKIPLSRIVNKILDRIIIGYDGIKIKENGIPTIYINKSLIKL